ncbi:MAG: tetratricopeptide repeat-containing S1 family peptidase [Candidatus Hydrogenedens sp.]
MRLSFLYFNNSVLLFLIFLFLSPIMFPDVSLEDLVKQKQNTVLLINCIDSDGNTIQGSGFCISSDGYVLATAHQVKDSKKIEGKNINGKTFPLKVEYISEEKDISVLKSQQYFQSWVDIFNTDTVNAGASIFTLASPDNLAFSVITGTVSNSNRIYKGNKVYQLTLYADPGASGAPVFNKEGVFIGMIIGKLEGTAFSLAISSKEIEKFLENTPLYKKNNNKVDTTRTQLMETEIIPLPNIDPIILSAIEAYNKGINTDDIKKKFEYYKKSAQLFPEFFEAWFNLGVVSELLGDLTNAEKAYKQAININPSSLETTRNFGCLLLKENRLEEAKTIFEKAVELCSTCPQVYNDLGETYRRMNQFEQAEKCFNKAIALDSKYALAYYNLGLIHLEKEDEEKAIQYFQEYTKYTKENSDREKVSLWIEEMKKRKKIQ